MQNAEKHGRATPNHVHATLMRPSSHRKSSDRRSAIDNSPIQGGLVAQDARLWPRDAGVLLLERGLELRIAIRPEGGPIEGGFEPFALGGAEPELHRQAAFADVRMRLERKAFVELHL